jgi:hypothetical protein
MEKQMEEIPDEKITHLALLEILETPEVQETIEMDLQL